MARVVGDESSEPDSPNMAEVMKDLIKEITCPYCNRHFEEPKLMQCCHYFCKECISSMLQASDRKLAMVTCPECHAPTQVPEFDPENLPSARFMSRLKSVYARVSETSRLDVTCSKCSKEPASAYCHRCDCFVCVGCVHSHDAVRSEVASGAAMQGRKKDRTANGKDGKSKAKDTKQKVKDGKQTSSSEKKKFPKTCAKHGGSEIKYYCFDCDCAICYNCTVTDHVGHGFQLIKLAVAHCKQFLNESLATLQEAKKANEAAVKSSSKKADAILKKVYNNAEIVETIQRLQTRIEDRKCELLSQVESVAQKKIENIEVQRKSITAASTKIEHLVKFVEDNLQLATDSEFVEIHQLMMDRIEEERKKLHLMKMEPPEDFEGLKTDPSEYAIEITSNEAKILEFDMTAKNCTVTGENLDTAEVNKPIITTVQTLYRKGFICTEPQQVEGDVYTFVGHKHFYAKVVRKEMGKYEITFTPEHRGQYKLEVNVNGASADRSPYFIFADLPPSKLGLPVKVITDVKMPFAITLKFRRIAHIAECMSADVIRTCAKQNVTCDGEIKNEALLYPRGLAIGEADSIFVANTGHHNVVKLDAKGFKVASTGKKGSEPGEFNYPMDVGVTPTANRFIKDRRVYVSDTGNKRVQVFNDELEFIRVITAADLNLKEPSFESLAGIEVDDKNHVYIADRGVNRIHVVDPEGKFEFSFGADDASEFELDKPSGVCVFRKHVFVSELGSNRISIFEKNGKFVRCFGVLGKVEGCFHWPFRIAFDTQGFLHVCDCLNDRVQVF